MESMPRRARHLISLDLPHRREVMAACAVLLVVAHLLVAQLTLGLAVAFTLIGRASRWRLWWLTGPAAVGLAWALVAGPAQAAAGFAAGSAHVLDYLGHGQLGQRLGHPLEAFAGAGGWLPRQFPIALISGAAEAAVIGWLGWLHTDELAVPPRRPGAIAAIRAGLAAALIRSGSVVTREGCALGVDPATGAVVDLRWREIAGGVLVVGAVAQEVTVTSLQVVHAALRRRKPVIVIDPSADAAIAGALSAACTATGTRLRAAAAEDLEQVVRERSAALLRVRSPEVAVRACGAVGALGRNLRRIGVDGDGLVWIPGCDSLPAAALVPLIGAGGAVGLPVLMTTTSAAVARELAGLVGVVLIHRLADPTAAADMVGQAGLAGLAGPKGRPAPLGAGEFVLAVTAPRRRQVERGRLVPARLPRPVVRQERTWRRLRYDAV
jgi:predicted aconitase with swiveling domain